MELFGATAVWMRGFSIALLAWVLVPSIASAQEDAAVDPVAQEVGEEDPIAWRAEWTEFQAWEYVAAPTLLAAAAATRIFVPLGDPNWTGTLPGEDAVDDALGVSENTTRYEIADKIADGFYYASLANALLDPLIAAGLAGGNWETAAQLLLINLEAYSVVAAVLFFSQLGVRRARPRAADCRAEPVDPSCGGDDVRSWPGGHLSVVTANAALTCLHHSQLPLYGGPAADGAACGAWIAGAAATFVTRLVTRSHYLFDQVSGAARGVLAGFVMPYLLHYAGSDEPDDWDRTASVLPRASESELGLQAVGFW
jgi:hypothetical protein